MVGNFGRCTLREAQQALKGYTDPRENGPFAGNGLISWSPQISKNLTGIVVSKTVFLKTKVCTDHKGHRYAHSAHSDKFRYF
jgi:hypothetical protein